jgi:hypothetical protein
VRFRIVAAVVVVLVLVVGGFVVARSRHEPQCRGSATYGSDRPTKCGGGEGVASVTVPRVVGESPVDAAITLARSGFAVQSTNLSGTVVEPFSGLRPRTRLTSVVLRQSPVAGSRQRPGTVVGLYVQGQGVEVPHACGRDASDFACLFGQPASSLSCRALSSTLLVVGLPNAHILGRLMGRPNLSSDGYTEAVANVRTEIAAQFHRCYGTPD